MDASKRRAGGYAWSSRSSSTDQAQELASRRRPLRYLIVPGSTTAPATKQRPHAHRPGPRDRAEAANEGQVGLRLTRGLVVLSAVPLSIALAAREDARVEEVGDQLTEARFPVSDCECDDVVEDGVDGSPILGCRVVEHDEDQATQRAYQRA